MLTNRLLRHDIAVLVSAVRRSLTERANALTVLIGLPLLFFVTRAWLEGLPGGRADLVVGAAGFVIAFVLVRVLAKRVRYHQTDGVVAAAALRRAEIIRFMLVALMSGMATGLAAACLMAIAAAPFFLMGFAAGALGGVLWVCLAANLRRMVSRLAFPTLRRSRAVSPAVLAVAGASAGLFCALLPLPGRFSALLAGALGLAASVFIGRVDPGVVRYMTMVGYSSESIIRIHLTGVLSLLLPLAAALMLSGAWELIAVGGLFAIGAPLLVSLLCCAYRAFARHVAEWVVTFVIASAVLAGLAMPLAAGVFLIAGGGWLYARGRHAEWLLA